MVYKLGSLFDGSGGFPLAGSLCGVEPMWAAEVEPYPIAVTRSRFPNMKHLGDISKINGGKIEPVDIITFGSPCQDLSVAGKRAGLKHEANGDEETTRSGLFMEAVRIIKEMREATNGEYPSFALWENVPGAFSSNKGEDFRRVCEELIKIVEPTAVMPAVPKNGWPYADSYCGDGWSLAYRVFDAQFWGVPQRRRRIHLVIDFRGQRAREVSFEREGVRGYFETGRTPWQRLAFYAQGGIGADDREGENAGGRLDAVGVVNAIGGNAENYQTSNVLPTLTNGTAPGFMNAVAYTLKIRAGCEGGGKGALVQEDKSATLATNNDQYLFQPIAPVYAIDKESWTSGQGWNRKPGITEGGPCPTLQTNGVAHAVAIPADAAGFCTEHSAKARGVGFQEECAPTLRAGVTPACVYSVENHPADSRVDIDGSGKVQTLTSRMGTGGGNVPMVLEPIPVHDQATRFSSKRGDKSDGKGNGLGVGEPGSPMNTLTSGDRHAVVYAIDRAAFNQDQNAQYDFEINDRGVNSTLVARGPGAVAYTASKASFFTRSEEELASTLVATDYKDPQIVAYPESAISYIVRRLTPTECARLQGFADRWGDIDEKDSLTPEEFQFWHEVRNTHAAINGKKVMEYTEAQMLTWYNKLHTDSAEYKMWGNGIALPPALYVLQGMVEALNKPAEKDEDEWMS